jgi:hypothetical protein
VSKRCLALNLHVFFLHIHLQLCPSLRGKLFEHQELVSFHEEQHLQQLQEQL